MKQQFIDWSWNFFAQNAIRLNELKTKSDHETEEKKISKAINICQRNVEQTYKFKWASMATKSSQSYNITILQISEWKIGGLVLAWVLWRIRWDFLEWESGGYPCQWQVFVFWVGFPGDFLVYLFAALFFKTCDVCSLKCMKWSSSTFLEKNYIKVLPQNKMC